MFDEKEALKNLVAEQKNDISVLMRFVRGMEIIQEDEDAYIKCQYEKYELTEAQKILYEDAIEVLRKYKYHSF